MNYVMYGVVAVIVLLILIFYKMWIGAALAIIGFVGYGLIYDFAQAAIMVAS